MNQKTLSLLEMNQSFHSLQALANKELPARISYRLARVMQQFNELLKPYNEELTKLQKKYASSKSLEQPGQPISFDDVESQVEYYDQLKDLQADEVNIKVSDISADDLGDATITPALLMPLFWLFTDEL